MTDVESEIQSAYPFAGYAIDQSLNSRNMWQKNEIGKINQLNEIHQANQNKSINVVK